MCGVTESEFREWVQASRKYSFVDLRGPPVEINHVYIVWATEQADGWDVETMDFRKAFARFGHRMRWRGTCRAIIAQDDRFGHEATERA